MKEDFEKYGYSTKCSGCAAMLKGTAHQAHSEACRKRIEVEMKDEVKVKDAKRKMDEFHARLLEDQDADNKKRKKVEDEKGEKDEDKYEQWRKKQIIADEYIKEPSAEFEKWKVMQNIADDLMEDQDMEISSGSAAVA